MFYYTLLFDDEMLASCLNPTLQYYPLLAVCKHLCDIHRYSSYFRAVSSNCSSRTCHVVMTRDPHNMESYAFNSAAPFTVSRLLQRFWGDSSDFWQTQWDRLLDVIGDDPFTLFVYGKNIL